MVLYKDFHFVHQSLVNLMNRQQGKQNIYMQLRGVVESWIMMSSLLFLRHQGNDCRIVC